jgi:iron-sulfur cluster repair protein YtfE (RIC family)
MATPPIDVLELLTRDHQRMSDLAQQLEATEEPTEVRRLYLRLVEEISAHEAAEQQVVFPAFRAAVTAGQEETRHRLGEHEEVNGLLAEMRSLSPTSYGFSKRASALYLELQAHFSAEEEELFPALRAALSRDRLVELAYKVRIAKETAPPFPEPPGEAVRAPVPAEVHRGFR